ncbi:hypothetical protein ACQEWB_17215 [Streptomyces sp. CA-249302]|uniref:hypothetical protein n=1 Tax=Streptomyces sp. CA-249302 TaxID=3240058 RepID=UPI003D8A5F76
MPLEAARANGVVGVDTNADHLAIAVADLDFTTEKTREKHGRKKRFRKLISGLPTSRLRSRLMSMAAELGIPVVAVDPAYTSRWGAQHWQKPLTTKTSRHDPRTTDTIRAARLRRERGGPERPTPFGAFG